MELFDWPILATAAGAATATTIIVAILKGILGLEGRENLVAALIVAEIVTIGAALATGAHTASVIGLAALNGTVVAASATGLHQWAKKE